MDIGYVSIHSVSISHQLDMAWLQCNELINISLICIHLPVVADIYWIICLPSGF